MKKFAYILIGCFAALIISVAFIACDKKNNSFNGGGEEEGPSLVGTWKWNFEAYDMVMTLEIKADQTGKLTIMDPQYPGDKQVCIFNWKYIYEDVIRLKVVSGYAGMLYGQGEQMDLTVEWFGANTVYFNESDYPDASYGPFIRQ